MNNDKQRLIASKGGKAAHTKGTAHEWSTDEARAAGRKGGESRGSRSRMMSSANNAGVVASTFLSDAVSSLRNPEEYANVHAIRASGVDAVATVG